MKDYELWFDDAACKDVNYENMFIAFKERLIDEGFIEANPKRWVRPDKNEVYDYFSKKIATNHVEDWKSREMADGFYNYWDSKEWYRGKTRIKKWKSAASTWIGNNYDKSNGSNSGKTRKLSVSEQVAANIAAREDEDTTQPEMFGSIVADHG